jgi:pimeloyl-ACP methyl ester carboxylesterase
MQKIIPQLIGFYLNILAFIAPKKAGKLGFRVFCYPARVKISKRQRQFLHTGRHFTIQHNKEEIQGYKWGNGPVNILLLHGWQSHTYRWKRYVEAIDKNVYTIYAIDAPGHGLSSGSFMTVPLYSAVVAKVIEHIGRVPIVIGHSLGSFTAMYTFYKHPHLLPDTFIATACPGNAQEFFRFYQTQLRLNAACMNLIVQRFEKEVKHPPAYFSAPSFAANLTIPGLLIHDEEDKETLVENAHAIHQAWKGSKLILTKGKGHNLKSDEVVNHVTGFIARETIVHEKARKNFQS